LVVGGLQAEEKVTIADAKKDEHGFLIYEVQSTYQVKPTQIRILQPDKVDTDKKYPVVYVLPVEPGTATVYSDGLKEIKKLDLHNKHGVFFVAPTFADWPWYADHPTKPEIRQESYLLHVVIPFIEKTYPVLAKSDGRYLLGFSKSGWGAWSLLLRHPDHFHKAVAWDAPLMLDKHGPHRSGEIFGTAEDFENYCVSKLLEKQADKFQNEKRLLLLGYGNFRAEHEKVHALMDKLKIAHEYKDGPARKHDWHSGWVSEAVELLFTKP
jgi:S-formylglutathione hydrolase FrmB